MVVLRSRFGTILVALAMVASAAVAGALIGEVTGANAVVSSGEKPVMIDMSPTRGLDTRGAPYGPIGVATAAPIGAKGVLNLTLAGKFGIPADATAVQLNVTTLNATAETFLTLYGAGTPRPNASTMNPDVGMTQFNGAVIPLGVGGAISIYNHLGSVNVLIDITGYFTDHNHDDRYYTKADADTAGPQWVHIRADGRIRSTSPLLRGTTVVRPNTQPAGYYCIKVPDGSSGQLTSEAGWVQIENAGGVSLLLRGYVTATHADSCNGTGSFISVQTVRTDTGSLADAEFMVLIPRG
jgi:hypothetical protein